MTEYIIIFANVIVVITLFALVNLVVKHRHNNNIGNDTELDHLITFVYVLRRIKDDLETEIEHANNKQPFIVPYTCQLLRKYSLYSNHCIIHERLFYHHLNNPPNIIKDNAWYKKKNKTYWEHVDTTTSDKLSILKQKLLFINILVNIHSKQKKEYNDTHDH